MDDPHTLPSQTTEAKNILPDVVHSQQIPAIGDVVTDEIEAGTAATAADREETSQDVEDSGTESISEHIPSKLEYSTDSEHEDKEKLGVAVEQDKLSRHSSENVAIPHSPASDNPATQDHSRLSASWPLGVNAASDAHLSNESPVNLALSSDISKVETHDIKSLSPKPSADNTPAETPEPRSADYLDSINEFSDKSQESVDKLDKSDNNDESDNKESSGSEEIIKLDIRGQGVPKYVFPSAKIIFGPPPEGSTILEPNMKPIPVFPNLLSPFLVGANDNVNVEEVFASKEVQSPEKSMDESPEQTCSDKMDLSPEISLKENLSDKTQCSGDLSPKDSLCDKIDQNDLLVEELTVDEELKEKESQEDGSLPPKSMVPEETMSFSTMTTDYKTICEEYHAKLVHLEAALTQRDDLIEELTVSLQRSVRERDNLTFENRHLSAEVCNLQHALGSQTPSEHDTIKAQLSDLYKYHSLIKDDSTKFYSAIMSDGSSLRSSNGEKDNDREEITVNYSRSDLKSDESDDFQTGFESKIGTVLNKFDEFIEDNLRNKLRESLIQVLCDEIGKMRIDFDTDIKELETQLNQDKQAFCIETRRLRELLASVKSGNADIEELRNELSVKHEKEMENLRTYFEKKCSDMERSYSEDVWQRRCASALGSASSLEGVPDATGDHARRRTRSAELPSLSLESTPLEHAVKQIAKKYEQQIEDMKTEHVAYVEELQTKQREVVATMEDQISQLKTIIQNSESNILYPQDIDLELEKKMEVQFEQRLEEVREEVRQDVVNHLQEQLQVLLSDPDAEVASWPLELVALRDRIHGDTRQEKELSSLRDELSGAGEDKWKQRRNLSFDQNRQLDEVTKERDDLRRVAVSLHAVVGQLVAYCACAEDELNRTVLAQLLGRLLPDADETLGEEESRPSTPNLNLSVDLNTSALSRGGGKHVHFAPDLNSILADLDEDGIVGFLQHQRDLSADIKRELEHSLRRLRHEAHSLLDLSERRNTKKSKMLESSVLITEMVQDIENKQQCANCDLHRKSMEETMSECLQREKLLRAELEAAVMKIAQLMTSADVIAEGYGTDGGLQLGEVPRARRSPAEGSPPRSPTPADRLQADIDRLQRERDDLYQQLEAANRQLRSTRQFVEEQASEREAERDEFAKRSQELRDENTRLATRLQNNARILSEMRCLRLAYCNCREHDAHVEQLEAQTREMNQIIAELETKKSSTDDELKATEEKITLLRDIIANLENQLEQKTAHENEILEQLEQMKQTIEDRDGKMRSLLGELEAARSEKFEQSDVMCVKCGQEEDKVAEMLEKVKEQCRYLEESLHRRTRKLERVHEVCSHSCSEPSEDVSLRDQRRHHLEAKSPEGEVTPRVCRMSELAGLWDGLDGLARAEDAALKRVADLEMQRAQLKDVAQEVRAERDVLQARMSEQALKISSLSARLQQQRNDAEALSHQATSQLSVQLHDALAEVQRLKEDMESKDKQLTRLKQNLEEKEKLHEQHNSLYGNSCNQKDKVMILERELSTAQTRIAQLEQLARSLEQDKDELQAALRDHQRALAEKEDQLQELLALKLDEENKDEKSDLFEGKASGRTLSDIVSISEFDEQDLQMRRLDLKAQNLNISGAPFVTERDKAMLNITQTPDVLRPNMSSSNIEYVDHFEIQSYTPRADSLPAHLTSTQNKDVFKEYKRNANETTLFGNLDKVGEKIATAQNIPDNCSMYPNRDIDDTKDNSVEPKKINFSLEPTLDNKSNDEEFTSLRELGITLDIKQENFPDILTQLKHEIKKSRTELENCKSELKNAEEQLCEFPALKEEVEELKSLLENTMATMENDKKFYENQLDNFSSNKKLLEQRLTELTQEANEKSKDLHLLKEDILRRENMILELAKEKRNLTNKMTELEVKIDELQSRNNNLERCESENHHLREKATELQRLEHLVSEKNQQIDSLNQHLDRLDDMQRRLNDKTEEFDNLKEAFEDKSNELFQLQDTVEALNRDIAKLNEHNDDLNTCNKELTLKLTKLEKEQENASLKLQKSESEVERMHSLNAELTLKIEELKLLTDKLKDKETEIEILHEDINSFHEEIASLKEALKMVSRSPSPRSKSGDERRSADRQPSGDKKQLVKIRKQISLLQHELDFNKKELNDQAFELAKAKLDVTELRNNLSQATKVAADREAEGQELRLHCEGLQAQMQHLLEEKRQLAQQLEHVLGRMREESNVSELKSKLQQQVERCQELEAEVQDMRDVMDRVEWSPRARSPPASSRALAVRSPTAELERALRDQLDYSHTLDEHIMEQILSASSDERDDIPRLALNSSKSTSSVQSSSSERLHRLRAENDKLLLQLNNLEQRLSDKDALITELNRVRDQLVQEYQTCKLRWSAEQENCARLQLLLDTQKESSHTLQSQDANMIQILKQRLESAMQSELTLQQRCEERGARAARLERDMLRGREGGDELVHQMEANSRLSSEISLLKSKLEVERTRYADLQTSLEHARAHAQRDLDQKTEQNTMLKAELAEIKRLKHEASVEVVRSKELLNTQSATIVELERKLTSASLKHRPTINDALTEIEGHKSELAREIASFKKCLTENSSSPELTSLRNEKQRLTARVQKLEADLHTRAVDEKDQTIRYLHGRCLRLESYRKALVWQKRYLQRVVAGYCALERSLRPPQPARGVRGRFKCVVTAVVAVLRMGFLVRRRLHVRAIAATTIMRRDDNKNTPRSAYTGTSPPSRDRPAPRPADSVPRRALRNELRLTLPASPTLAEFTRRSPFTVNSPREEPFILSSPRGDAAAAYLNKLELVSRCLNHAMDAARDVP